MTRYTPFDNLHIMAEYEAYAKKCIEKGDLMPLLRTCAGSNGAMRGWMMR